jgi:glycosyltransferase involved in cell wall biosynthesis
MRILYIQATWVPPPHNLQADRFVLLSERLEGDVLQPVWFKRGEEIEAEFGPGAYPEYTRKGFRFNWLLSLHYKGGWHRRLATLWFYVRKGLQIHRQLPYDCIVVYSHMIPALVAVILKWLTGAKLIVEIMTAPELSYLYEHPEPTLSDRIMRLFSDFSLHASVLASDRVHLLYKTQLAHYPFLRRVPVSVFHDFVPISLVPRASADTERFLLLVGAPWYLKGVDLIIDAFRRVADEFPDVALKIQGFYWPEAEKVEALAASAPRTEILKAVPHAETLERISRAFILVHPSRCDGLARVLIEGMGAGVPIIASDAGGNPQCIRDGENGLLFRAGDVDQLTGRLRELLADGELRTRLGATAYYFAHAQWSERVYVDQFTRMVEHTVRGEPEPPAMEAFLHHES